MEQAAWYCARTKPKHEHIAAANVAKRLGLEVFCPRLRSERATRRGLVRTQDPLFPCYLFVRCVLSEHGEGLRYVNGISSLVRFGERAAEVPAAVIEDLQSHFMAEEPVMAVDPLSPGMEVTVAAGAFEGMRANVLRVMPARQRVQVLLDILGRPTEVEVERKLVVFEQERMADRVPFLAAA